MARKQSQQSKELQYDRNDRIRAPKMRIIDEGENLGVLSREEALNLAREKDLDLVLISPLAEPPVAKIMSWSKFKYELSKKKKESKGKKTEVKEMWFKPHIEEGDIVHKAKRVQEFVQKGDRVKITIKAKGRVTRKELEDAMQKVMTYIEQFAVVDNAPTFEGRNYTVFVKSK